MIRLLAFIGGLGGAVSLSQFPEFSQQYLQRLAGAVDELQVIVETFDADAKGANLTRDEALALLPDDNAPRFDSILEYCQTIGVSFDKAMQVIDEMPKLY